ncbi:hypothetical protein P7K49_002106 [Saguinus oedipus]|uniref:Uncharacterized protein n=1 Tax=Saguinus oedipus TaxID=9490 RepID=A0ABQ9WGZ3_SAGOE|nr:hypothetical protein P7K49_002106 [Saguinus oedipus]
MGVCVMSQCSLVRPVARGGGHLVLRAPPEEAVVLSPDSQSPATSATGDQRPGLASSAHRPVAQPGGMWRGPHRAPLLGPGGAFCLRPHLCRPGLYPWEGT